MREGIDWTFITFNDNQTVIDLIETRPLGILSLLDEECKVPRGNDDNWCTKLYGSLSAKYGEVFRKPKFGWQRSFIIQHFADVVTYSVGGFVEKNRDKMEDEVVELLKSSEVIGCLFAEDLGASGAGGAGAPGAKGGADGKGKGAGGKVKITHQDQRSSAAAAAAAKKAQKATVGWQFKESLEALMKILNSTEPHYVRCIKPNDVKGAFTFNNERAVQQLRACGVLETIRISSNGFPSRWSYQDFANRYRVLRVGYAEELARMRAAEVAAENEARGIGGGGGGGGPPKPTPRKLVKASSGSSTAEIRQICEDIVKIVYGK